MRTLLTVLALVACLPMAGLSIQPDEAAPERGAPRFLAYDIVIDTGDEGLAAYQVDVRFGVAGGTVLIVGVENGEHLAYADAPYYDPAAIDKDADPAIGGRVILAAIASPVTENLPDPADTLPTGSTRVARVHVVVEGDLEVGAEVGAEVTLVRALDVAGDDIDGQVKTLAKPAKAGDPE